MLVGSRSHAISLLFSVVASGPAMALSASLRREAVVDVTLQNLRSALLAKDGDAVLRITEEIRKPFIKAKITKSSAPFEAKAERSIQTGIGKSNARFVAKANQTGIVEPKILPSSSTSTGSELHKPSSKCIFDDHLFSLTPAAKRELQLELKSSPLSDSVDFVRRGGWWDCAYEDRECKCDGVARMVDIDRNEFKGSSHVDVAAKGGSVACAGVTFGVQRPSEKPIWPSPGIAQCECKSSNLGKVDDGFHLEKRLSSTTRLQEAWIFLLRLLAHTGQIPLGTGDRTYSGMGNWAKRGLNQANDFGYTTVLERFWIVKYLRDVAWYSTKGPRCLEWGNPQAPGQHLLYAGLVPGCTSKYDLQFDQVYHSGAEKTVSGNVIYSDIMSLPQVLATAGLQMDVIFATQVFEHLAEPLPAAAALHEATAPGGVLIVTAPQQAQFHKVPHDYFRYTKEGLKFMLVKAGFCVPNDLFVGGGDFVFDIARDAGLQVQDFSLDEMEAAFQVGYDYVSDSAITIHALAFKPPHPRCPNTTAVWQEWQELQRTGMKAAL